MFSASFGFMRRCVFFLAVLATAALAQTKAPATLLPHSFSGWQIDAKSVKAGSDPAAVDPADFSVLKEYGFAGSEAATYGRNGRKMQIKAVRFADASGAFGAFTYYDQPQMRMETIGDAGASNNTRILFYKGNILVDATLQDVTAMSGADLRSLADALPRPKGNLATLPALLNNLPAQSRLPNTSRYVVGPEALSRLGVSIPAQLLDFSKSPELVMAKYRTSTGEAGLTIVGYPTPQIARERIAAMPSSGTLPGGPYFFKRSGPFVAVMDGSIPADEAQSLLASVNYDADVTWNQPTKVKPADNRA